MAMKYCLVQSPSTFPVASRPVYLYPIADVTYKTKAVSYPEITKAVETIAERHGQERILVHTVSYELARFIWNKVGISVRQRCILYEDNHARQRAIDKYVYTDGAILLASSLERGIDLPDESCRAIIVCKVPYPSLGDKQINARLYSKGGQFWYSVQTCRTIVQMTGRGMRSANDYCESFIIDRQFITLWRKCKSLFPKWWTESLVWDAGRLV